MVQFLGGSKKSAASVDVEFVVVHSESGTHLQRFQSLLRFRDQYADVFARKETA